MAKITILFAILLIALGLIGFFATGSQYPTSLIPTWFGLALGIGGFFSISPSESRRKLFAHINVTLGLLGFLGTVVGLFHFLTGKLGPMPAATEAKAAMSALCLIYTALCVRSFITARRSGKV